MSLFVDSESYVGVDAWSDCSGMKTKWGDGMFLVTVGADKDHTIDVFTEQYVVDNFDIIIKVTRKNDDTDTE